jgi:ribosome modulation factor
MTQTPAYRDGLKSGSRIRLDPVTQVFDETERAGIAALCPYVAPRNRRYWWEGLHAAIRLRQDNADYVGSL